MTCIIARMTKHYTFYIDAKRIYTPQKLAILDPLVNVLYLFQYLSAISLLNMQMQIHISYSKSSPPLLIE